MPLLATVDGVLHSYEAIRLKDELSRLRQADDLIQSVTRESSQATFLLF